MCALLTLHGFVNVRQKGSHCVMQKRDSTTTITVPVPMHSDLKPGTLASIIRQSQLPKNIFD
jgi:predicted RNA binding protein YcfA (HicA-like mRNA interferase family)